RRQQRSAETETMIELALARAEEAVMQTHVDNAIGFTALLDDYVGIGRAVSYYLGAVLLSGSRAHSVLQRTMARLADVHLPRCAAADRSFPACGYLSATGLRLPRAVDTPSRIRLGSSAVVLCPRHPGSMTESSSTSHL